MMTSKFLQCRLSATRLFSAGIFLLTLTCSLVRAQVTVTNTGEVLYFTGTTVYINGNYVNAPTAPASVADPQIFLNSPLYVNGNVVSNGALNLIDEDNSGGFLELFGGSGSFDGGSPIILNRLRVNRTNGLNLNRNLSIAANSLVLNPSIELLAGSIDLQSFEIDLGESGSLVGENDVNRVFSASSGTIAYVLNMSPTIGDNPGGLGFQLEGSILGGVEIRRGHATQATAGDGSILRYYDVNLNSGDVINSVRFNYLSPELNGITENDLRLYVSYDAGASWVNIGGSVSATSNYVESTGLSLSADFRITLSDKDCAAPPIVDLGLPTQNLCSAMPLNLDAGNPGASFLWSTGETTQNISVSTAGTYSVTVTDAKGCIGFDTVDLISRPSPTVAFTNSISCEGQIMNFTNGTSIATGTVTYQWDFGDPATTSDVSTDTNPSYTYGSYSVYPVTLTATSDFNCVSTLVKNVTAFPIPSADFSFTPGCLGSATSFANLSSVPIGGMTYQWDFGDGQTSTSTSPSNTFSAVSTYNVSLVVTSNANCVNSISKPVSVNYTPVANFSVNNLCEQINLNLANNSTIALGSLNYAWDFGDASSSTDPLPVKAYSSSGTYNITLTVTSDSNCTDMASQPVDVFEKPVASFSITDDCQNKPFDFVNNSVSGQGSMSFLWDFGDGQTSSSSNPSKLYSSPGLFDVSLQTTTSFGCVDSQLTSIEVYPVPNSDFAFSDVCQDVAAIFANNTTIANGSFTSQWDFGDGNFSSVANPSHNYSTSGDYDVELTTTSNLGCENTIVKTVEIFPLPVIDLGGVINTCGVSYLLDAQNPGSSYLWSDGSTSQTLTVTENGIYSVTVTTGNNCASFQSVDITLKGEVVPNLGSDLVVCGGVILDAGFPGSTYLWTNGVTNRILDVSTSGVYGVTVTDQNDCTGYDEVSIVVNPNPLVDLGPNQVVCADQNVVLDAGADGARYSWSNGESDRLIDVTTSGTYSVSVVNIFDCETTDQVDITINPLPTVPFNTLLSTCDHITLDAKNDGSTYLWSDGSTARELDVSNSGIYEVEITTAEGCSIVTSTNLTVNESPQIDLGTDVELCYGENVTLDAGGQGDSYQWSTGASDQMETVSQSGIIWAEAIRNNGCVTRDSVKVTVFPQIQNTLVPAYVLCTNAPLTLDGLSPQGVNYVWRSASGILNNSSLLQVNQPIVAWLTTTDVIGCQVVDTVEVNVDPDPIVSRFLVASLVNVGDSVKFIHFAAPDPVSFSWDFDDGLTSIDPDPTHIYLRPADFNASLTVQDPNNCDDTETKAITVRLLRDGSEEEIQFPFVELINTKLYPNPATDAFSFDLELNRSAYVTVGLFSLNGTLVISHTFEALKDTLEFDLRNIPSGVYLLKLFVNNQTRTMRFVKI
ncbi:MAG: PKD domain-containing protein [Cyclobacteriaceae bacterium]